MFHLAPAATTALAVAASISLLGACSSGAGTHAAAPHTRLGEPVASAIAPAVVPSNAVVDDLKIDSSATTARTYWMPAGVTEADVDTWYQQYMTPNEDFEGLVWLETFPAMAGGDDWYWCFTPPGKTLDITTGQNEAEDGGQAFAVIAIQDDMDGDCGHGAD